MPPPFNLLASPGESFIANPPDTLKPSVPHSAADPSASPPSWIGQPAAEMLERSRQRVLAQWHQWREGHDDGSPADTSAVGPLRSIVVFSLARGVGRSTLAAQLAHALSGSSMIKAGADAPTLLLDLPSPTLVLIPITPDTSIDHLRAAERFLLAALASNPTIRLVYILNRVDPAQPSHMLRLNELHALLGEQLSPILLRESPNAVLTEDLTTLIHWLQTL